MKQEFCFVFFFPLSKQKKMLKISVLFLEEGGVYTKLTLKFQMFKLLVNYLGTQLKLVTFSSSAPNPADSEAENGSVAA